MKALKVGKRNVAFVDNDDYRWLKCFNWRESKGYAVCAGTFMHRAILDAPEHLVVDHINGNRLDNRKCNLRLATRGENNQNRFDCGAMNKTSEYKGVSFCERKKQRKQWRVQVRSSGKRHHIGYFDCELDAAKAYDKAASALHGEFASLNFTH